MTRSKHPVMLIVLDGWGHREPAPDNAISSADTPVWDGLWDAHPHTLIQCSGTAVGLPDQQMGNSEVGHMHIGAGRLIDQDFSRIGNDIAAGRFADNPVLATAMKRAGNGTVHVLGLLSPGGVHSHEEHMLALVDSAVANGAGQVLVHAFLDGRDTPPQSAGASLNRFEEHLASYPNAAIASICGRYLAMDRNKNWERTRLAYELLVDGRAEHTAATATAALEAAYARGETDEFVTPVALRNGDGAGWTMADGDVVVFANFRADRARQITAALTAPDFAEFARDRVPALAEFVTMTDYGDQFALPIAYPAVDLPNTFGAVVSAAGMTQLRIAETEKYAHVTFFFNGGEEKVFDGESRKLIPSPDVATYDLQPEMSAPAVTAELVQAIESEQFDAIICNYANADMVGHTGNFAATVECVEALDRCLGDVIAAAREHGVDVLITADHGNAERMQGERGPHTAHTSNLVPLLYVGRSAEIAEDGALSDLAPTLLSLLGVDVPPEMTGRPLVRVTSNSAQDAA